jgi:hypothetical protein
MQTAAAANERADSLGSFRTFLEAMEEGASIPTVSEEDLRRLHEAWSEMAKRSCGKDGAMSLELMARVCSPGANLAAVWIRYTRLRRMLKQGALAEWQHGANLEGAVFQVAATIPMNGIGFGEQAFIQRLREN